MKLMELHMHNSLKKLVFAAVVTGTFLTGCATSEKVQVTQMGDDSMSCGAMQAEMAKLDASKSNIDSKKGMTGTNVAAALFWLPGLMYTYYDAGQAEKLITDRKSALTEKFNNKKCAV
jgi:outer membrane murein-binding lipoprotein Lpp